MHAIRSVEDLYAAAKPFVKLINEFAQTHVLEGDTVIDHICYKCESGKSFDRIRALFEPAEHSLYIYQSIIPPKVGRRVAYIRLKRSLKTLLGPIEHLELSDQKADGSQKEGFDHVEAYPTRFWRQSAYEALVEQIAVRHGVRPKEVDRPHHATHDIDMGNGFEFRASKGPLIRKIAQDEMGLSLKLVNRLGA